MTLAIDGSGPVAVKSDPTAVSSLTTAAFTPPAGALLVAVVLLDVSNIGPTITPSTITGSTSAWTTVEVTSVNNGKVAIYWATVTSSVSTTVRAAFSTSTDAALEVMVFTGQHATPIGSHGQTVISTNPQTISYTAGSVGSIGVLGVESYQGGGVTVSNTTLDVSLTSNSAGRVVHQTTPATSLSTQSYSVGGTTNSPAAAYAEIVPAGSAGPSSGGTLAAVATLTASGSLNTGLATGATLTATATLTADGVLSYPFLAGKPVVVVTISNPAPTGGAAATLVTDLYRTSPDGTTARIAANLSNNATVIDYQPTAGPNVYVARAFSASGASASSA